MLEDIFRALPVALLVADGAGRIRLSNDAAVELLGRAAADLDALTIADVFDDASALSPQQGAGASETARADVYLLAKGGRIPVTVSTTRIDGSHEDEPQTCVAIELRDLKAHDEERQRAHQLEFVRDSIEFVREGLRDLSEVVDRYRVLRASVERGEPSVALAAELSRVEQEADLDYLIENLPGAMARSLDGLSRVSAGARVAGAMAHAVVEPGVRARPPGRR